ncbi:MAG: metallophosphoesterase [Flavobacteriales bacterium]|nr:metallophosphoesterase [Flavobacteriales bacterium]
MGKVNLLICCILMFVVGCKSDRIFVNNEAPSNQNNGAYSKMSHAVYLIGDVGGAVENSSASLKLLSKELKNSDPENTSVVFLGDNIYPRGLHKKSHPLRADDERRLNAQLDIVKNFDGEVVFIPGNHDWEQGGKEGFDFNKRQEDYIQKYLGNKVYHPSDGCSGPKEIQVSDELTIIAIDTQWLLHKFRKGRGEEDDCATSTIYDFMFAFKEALKRNRTKHVIVVGHHPMYSNGVHGGYFTIKDHLFPLIKLNPNLIIPLPLIGSIYPFYRSFLGDIQDIQNPKYRSIQEKITNAIGQYDNVVYANGHEHNLQYQFQKNGHYITSGSGAKITSLRNNSNLIFGAEHKGFAKLQIHEEGEAVLKYFSANLNRQDKPILFEKKLYTKNIKGFKRLTEEEKISYEGKYKVVVADSSYAANKLKRVFFGKLNRDLWTQSIKVPYLDIHKIHGGLQPVERGGGQQTVSLKMIGGDGKKYKLRGIKKSAEFLVIRELRGTVAQEMVYDGIAGSHPYASSAVAKLLQAAELYYIESKLVYVPKDPVLGDYLDEFGGRFALLEVHPSNDMSDMPNFGNSEKVVNTAEAIGKLQSKQDHVVDVDFAVSNRLLDILIGDWDRHDDQWRWATFKEGGRTIYRPIPRDRDQAFFQFDGVVMNITNRKWLIRKFQPFKEEIRDIAGLGFNARYFDRAFLVEADLDTWINQAKALQLKLTDEVIENSMKALPPESFAINGEELILTLKARRNKLADFAERYYRFIAKTVDVVGTTDKDFFEVIRKDGAKVEVNIYPRKKGKKQESKRFYHRVFDAKETKEIRLYGLGGKDEYELIGEVDKSILVRIIAGDKKDKVKDESLANGWGKKTKVYDSKEGKNEIESSKETKVMLSKPGDEVYYDRKAFKYNVLLPLPSIGFNQDDGFIFGPGINYIKHGFNKDPFMQKHSLFVNYTFRAEGYNIDYDGYFVKLLGKTDVQFKAKINKPQVYQFYGFGNEIEPDDSQLGSSQVRMNSDDFQVHLARTSDDFSSKLSFVLGYRIVGIDEVSTADIDFSAGNEEFILTGIHYSYLNVDRVLNPSKGISFQAEVNNTQSINNKEVSFINLKGKFSFYIPLELFQKQTILAFRTAYSGNIGDFAFYQSNFLSGITELRGLPRNRFAGNSVAFGNAELRKSFMKNRNSPALFDLGMILHGDIGRVWYEKENSDKWHNSYGGGLFINILDFFALVGTYSISDQDELVNIGMNFYF